MEASDNNKIANLLPPIVEEPAECPTHGAYTARFIAIGKDRKGGRCPECAKEQEAAEKQAQADRRERLAREERERALEASGVPLRFVGKTFDDYVAESPEQQRAVKYARDLVEQIRRNPRRAPCLILAGLPGNGKTHLACAIVQALHGTRDVIRANMPDLIASVRATWAKNAARTTEEAVNWYASLDLLIIDEVGAGYGTDAERAELFRIIDRRYERLLPTMLVTNLTAEELKTEIGERVLDRMREEGGKLLTFTGQSQRRAKA